MRTFVRNVENNIKNGRLKVKKRKKKGVVTSRLVKELKFN